MEVLEFIEFLEDEKINPSPKIMSEINDNIVDGNKITNIKFKTLFEDLVDQEIKSFIIRII
jgi:pyrrolidone-carboxylate peptidase